MKAAERARLLFGCYRRGDANDPDTYCAATTAVLTRYSQAVVEYVTDPRTGIPGRSDWLPSVAEVRRACMERQAYLDRLDDLDRRFGGREALPLLQYERRGPGRRANVFVRADAPQYPAMIARANAPGTAKEDWRRDEEGRDGIWVAIAWLDDLGVTRPLPGAAAE